VINYDLPEDAAIYVRRIGRSGCSFKDDKDLAEALRNRPLCFAHAVYLEAIAESIRERSIVLVSGDEEFTATPGELVRVRVEAGRSEETVHVTIRLSWSEDALTPGQAPALRICSRKP